LISVLTTAWATLGYPATDLAFLITSTHPTPNSIGGESWFVNRPIFNANAQAWARANVNDGRNITYCDFEAYRTASQLNSSFNYSFYITESGVLTPYSVHLRTYALGAGTTFSETQVSTVPNPLPGGSTGMALPAIGSENGYFVLGNYMVEQLLK
jgi:hypothetical protein